MIKIAGTLPVKSRLPLSAWLVAALVTLFSLALPVTHVVSASQQGLQTAQKSQEGSVYCLLAYLAEVLTSHG
jgi:hypothetical protein